METVYQLIDHVLTRFGTGYCPYCHRITWCNLVWNAEQERFNPTCLDCFLGQLGITREHYEAILEPPDDEGSETPKAEEAMTRGELIRTLIGLMLIDALFTFGFRFWTDHDPCIASPFVYWFLIPMVSVFAIGMATLQLYWYTHPKQADGDEDEESEGNS